MLHIVQLKINVTWYLDLLPRDVIDCTCGEKKVVERVVVMFFVRTILERKICIRVNALRMFNYHNEVRIVTGL